MRPPPWYLGIPAVAIIAVVTYAGAAAGAWYAFTEWDGLGAAHWIGFGNFSELFGTEETRAALVRTLALAGSFFALVNLTGLGLALALNRTFPGRAILRSVFFLPAVLSPLAVGYVWQYIFTFEGPLNQLLGFLHLSALEQPWLGDPTWALWTVLVALVWQFSGLIMVIYLAGLQGISTELLEAASIDGASPWTTFRRVVLPLLAPAMTVSTTLTLIVGLRVFDQVIAVTGGGPNNASQTLATEVYQQTFGLFRFGYGAALALTLSAVIAVLALAQLAIGRARERRL